MSSVRSRSSIVAGAVAVVGGFALPDLAHAAFAGVANDPPGDAAVADPARDIVAAGIVYDRASGATTGIAAFAGAPGAGAAGRIAFVAANPGAGDCNAGPAIVLGGLNEGGAGARWSGLDATTAITASGEAETDGAGTQVVRFTVTDAALAGKGITCAVAQLTDAGATTVLDSVGPFPVAGAPSLTATLGKLPGPMRPARTRTIRLTVSNPGDGPTAAGSVRVSRARGLVATPRRTRLAPIAAGASRTVKVRVRLTSRARSTTTLEVGASAGRLRAVQQARLSLRRPARRQGSGSGSGTNQCLRYVPDISGNGGGEMIFVPC